MDAPFKFSTFQHNKQELSKKIAVGVLGIILIIAAVIVGIPDHLPGIILLFAGVLSVFYAFISHWTQAKRFLILLGFSLIGFVISVLLHNGIDALAGVFNPGILQSALLGLSGFFFILAVILFPVLGVLGLLGYLILSLKPLFKEKT